MDKQLVSDAGGRVSPGRRDSSVVAAAAARAWPPQTQTFCIGFDDPRFDESGSARAIASHWARSTTSSSSRPSRWWPQRAPRRVHSASRSRIRPWCPRGWSASLPAST
ncbi:MAG: hypothetical protein IPI43_29375 [Sandaracinaceae bacterium]|nr:hypothetical protein [Sandaracinaceae bacterium]